MLQKENPIFKKKKDHGHGLRGGGSQEGGKKTIRILKDAKIPLHFCQLSLAATQIYRLFILQREVPQKERKKKKNTFKLMREDAQQVT